jgi:hypothetical protein
MLILLFYINKNSFSICIFLFTDKNILKISDKLITERNNHHSDII